MQELFHYLHPLFLLPEGGEKAKNIFNNSDTFQPLLRQLFPRQILWISATSVEAEEDPQQPLVAASSPAATWFVGGQSRFVSTWDLYISRHRRTYFMYSVRGLYMVSQQVLAKVSNLTKLEFWKKNPLNIFNFFLLKSYPKLVEIPGNIFSSWKPVLKSLQVWSTLRKLQFMIDEMDLFF